MNLATDWEKVRFAFKTLEKEIDKLYSLYRSEVLDNRSEREVVQRMLDLKKARNIFNQMEKENRELYKPN